MWVNTMNHGRNIQRIKRVFDKIIIYEMFYSSTVYGYTVQSL